MTVSLWKEIAALRRSLGEERTTLGIYAEYIYRVTLERDRALAALDEIAARPTSELNPDGVDQAASTLALLAREHAKKIRDS